MRENDISKWEVDAGNKLKAYTLLEWGVAASEPYHVMLRIGYAISKWEWDTYKDTDPLAAPVPDSDVTDGGQRTRSAVDPLCRGNGKPDPVKGRAKLI